MSERYKELDSLRGLAALAIVLIHILLIAPDSQIAWDISHWTPYLLFTGRKVVIFFFILSGFVLSLPFYTGKDHSYSSFIIKRICRIYIPYLFCITIAMVLCSILSRDRIDGLGGLFYELWSTPISLGLIVNHFLFIGNYDAYAFDVVIWSLIHEIRISLIFPILIFFIDRFSWKINLAAGMIIALLGAGLHTVFQEPYQAYYKSLLYVIMFVVGILLGKHRYYLIQRFRSIGTISKAALLVTFLLIFNFSHLMPNALLVDWTSALGVSVLMILSLSLGKLSKLLLWSPFQYLGRISYSLYLYHIVILLSVMHYLYGTFPFWFLLIISFLLIFTVSNLSWHLIERPSIRLGNNLSHWLKDLISPTPVENDAKNPKAEQGMLQFK